MKAIQCGRCNVLIPLLNQYPVRGVPTFEYHCTGCNGKVHLQIVKGPDGRPVARQIRLTGSADEFRPQAISPREQMQIPVAYTLGSSPSSARSRVQAPPLQPPQPAYSLGSSHDDAILDPRHPMHPDQIRRRLHPVRF